MQERINIIIFITCIKITVEQAINKKMVSILKNPDLIC